ncbi:MAG TPA: hypothetical protein VE525_19455 [Rubrobacter sp.]|nr:hypothetical protein [Rubrobacter sp.]
MTRARTRARTRTPPTPPTGLRIALTTNRDGNPEIYVMDTDPATADDATRTNDDTSDFEPSWQSLP